jgi:uncharacterized membrane protein required for colicin V production
MWGFFRGLVRELCALVGLVAAVLLAIHGSAAVASRLEALLAAPWARQAVALVSFSSP